MVMKMGIYSEVVVPRVVDLVCGSSTMSPWRKEVNAGLGGALLEIGFGSGTNVEFYPTSVTSAVAIEPSHTARRLALKKIAASRIAISFAEIDGSSIPFADGHFDCALSSFTLCTVPDPIKLLGEVARVLKPGAALHFLEHGVSPDIGVANWQRRIDPIEFRLAGGCSLTRDIVSVLAEADYRVVSLRQEYGSGPKPWSYISVGSAIPNR